MLPFELRQIRVFLVLCEELHFGRTAERTGLTTSRVSQTIRALERCFGGQLFDRTSRNVTLTPFGDELRSALQPAYDQFERAYNTARVRAEDITGTLRLGLYITSNGGPHLLNIVDAFTAAHPFCAVDVVDTGHERDALDWLRAGEVHVLAARLPISDPDLIVGPVLSTEPRVVAVAANHDLAARASISYEDLADFPVTQHASFPAEMLETFTPPRTPSGRLLRRVSATTFSELMMRVARGQAVHPTVASFVNDHQALGLAAVPISDLPPSQTALVRLAATRNAALDAFIATAEQILAAGAG